jgi:hypothetical protein
LARAVCGPATTAFVRAFAAVGDGFGSALTAGSRAASPKLDPSRGHSLSGGQVATPPVLPRFRLRRLLPPLTPSSLPLRGHASAAGGRPPDFSNCSDLFRLRGKVFPLVRVCVSPSPFQRGHPATPRMPASVRRSSSARVRSIQLPARSLRFVRTGRRCGRRRLWLRAHGCLSRCVARARPFARSLRRDTGRLAALGPSPTPPSALTLCSTPLRACALAAGVTARRSDDASLAAGILPALACARFSFRLEHCVPFARVFAVVGDGCGSALAAASRDASPKRDPSRGHSLSKGQVATPAALPRSRLRRLLPPLLSTLA